MKLENEKNYKSLQVDISTVELRECNNNASLLERSVNVANELIIKEIKKGQSIIEIGCGTDSYLKNNLTDDIKWDGIDVIDLNNDPHCIATKQGSVDDIPFDNSLFDYAVSNQSIEHWYEFKVSITDGLKEISRVLKDGGVAHLNFPFFLHGHPFFIKGEIDKIINLIPREEFNINTVTKFYDSREGSYYGWRACGFPDWYVNKYKKDISSHVVEIVLQKKETPNKLKTNKVRKNIPNRINFYKRTIVHGVFVLLYKAVYEIKSRILKSIKVKV